jgi:hypothetical protein
MIHQIAKSGDFCLQKHGFRCWIPVLDIPFTLFYHHAILTIKEEDSSAPQYLLLLLLVYFSRWSTSDT